MEGRCSPQLPKHVTADMGDAVALWLSWWTRDQTVRVQAVAAVAVLCSWTKHFTLIVSLSTKVYIWVPVK